MKKLAIFAFSAFTLASFTAAARAELDAVEVNAPSTTANEAVAAPADRDAVTANADVPAVPLAEASMPDAPKTAPASEAVPVIEAIAPNSSAAPMNTETTVTETATSAAEAPAKTEETVRGTVVAVDMTGNEIVVRDNVSNADKRIDVDPNVLATTALAVGDNVRVDLSPSGGVKAHGVRIATE
jgi:hypothetical protein